MKHTKFQLIPIKITALGGGVTVRFTQISLKVCPEIQTHSFPHWFTAPILRRLQTSNAPSFSSFQSKLQFWGVVGVCALVVLVQKGRKKCTKNTNQHISPLSWHNLLCSTTLHLIQEKKEEKGPKGTLYLLSHY